MGRIIAVIAAVLTVFSCVVTAFADTGPKPAVHVTFENLGDAKCYATLLSKRPGGGPWSVWDGREEQEQHPEHSDAAAHEGSRQLMIGEQSFYTPCPLLHVIPPCDLIGQLMRLCPEK